MRGKVNKTQVQLSAKRITPAYAGKSFLSTSRAFCNQDHPRLCGEKRNCRSPALRPEGSPPPMRGKVSHSANSGFPVRITPAYAGKSLKKPQNASSY